MFYNNTGSTHLVIDLVGLFIADVPTDPASTGRIVLLEPFRDFDSREQEGPLAGGAAWGFEYPPTIAGLPVGGIVYNLTVTEPTSRGFVTVFPGDARAIPETSNANFVPGQTVANHVWARLPPPPGNAVVVYNGSDGPTHVVLDIQAVILA
jgi:hypothetical protein